MEQDIDVSTQNLIGKRVRSAGGKCVGIIEDIDVDSFRVCQRLLGFGPIIRKKTFGLEKIAEVDDDSVRLKPTEGEYWQTLDPNADEFDFHRNYFVL